MATVTAFQARTRFGELLDRVARGEEIVITRHEKAVARLVPEGDTNLEDTRLAVAEPGGPLIDYQTPGVQAAQRRGNQRLH